MSEPKMLGAPPAPYIYEMSYYRFWPDGQVLEKPRYGKEPDFRIPSAQDGDDFSGRGTGVGRYAIIGNELTMVFLGVDEGGWRWVKLHAWLNEDGSFTFSNKHHQRGQVARRFVIEGMAKSPDW